jgi:hypothetical protein
MRRNFLLPSTLNSDPYIHLYTFLSTSVLPLSRAFHTLSVSKCLSVTFFFSATTANNGVAQIAALLSLITRN